VADNLTLKVTLTGDGRQLSGTLQNASGEIREFGAISERGAAQAERGFDNTQRSAKRLGSELGSVNQVGSAVRNTLLGLGGALSVREVVRYTDAWTGAENMLRLVTDSSGELAAMQDRLMAVANETRSGFEGTANLYSRLARSTTELNLSQEQLIGLTTTINQSFATSGATAQEAEAAIVQLSQGLAAGALRGDEFNSVSEQAPGIMRAIADSLNMTIGELRDFAAEGGITAEIVVDALQGASDAIAQDFAGSVATFDQQLTVSRNNLVEWVGTSEEVRGAVGLLGDGLVTLTDNLDTLVDIGQVGAALFAGRFAQSLYTTAAAKIAANRAALTLTGSLRAMNGVMMTAFGPLGIAVTAAGVLYTFREELGLTVPKIDANTTAVNTLTGALDDMSRAEANLTLTRLVGQLAEAKAQAEETAEAFTKIGQIEGDGGGGFLGVDVTVQTDAVRELGQTSGTTRQEIADLEAAIALVNGRLGDLDREGQQVAPTVTEVRDATSSAAEAAEQFSNDLESLRKQLDPSYAAQRKLAQSTALLDRGLATGALTLGEYLDLWDRAAETFIDATNETEELGDTNVRVADEMSREWERFGNSVDDTFADAFRGAFDSFEDFADQLKGAFENLLAELAYAAVKNEIRIQLGMGTNGPMQGGITGSGGLLDSLSGSNTLISKGADLLGLTSSLGVAGSAPISYATGFGAQVATGTYTGALGNATAAASTSSSGILSGISAAAPWVAGALALDSMLDLGIVDGIVDGVSSALGISGKYAGEDPTGLLATRNAYGSAGRAGWERDAFATGALGDIGFAPDSRDIDTLFGERDNFENAKAFAEQLAQMDTTIAQLAESEAELDAMRQAAADAGLTDMVSLEDRYRAVLGSLGEEFDAYVDTLDGDLGEIVQQAVTAGQAFNVMSDAAERLNLQFDASATGAYETAAALAEAAGGIDQLASVQQAYYQAMYSEAERLSHQAHDLADTLSGVTDTVPSTTEELRAMVESADLSTEAGRDLAFQLMQLAPAFAQTSQAVEQAITEAYQTELDRAPDAAGLAYWMDEVMSGSLTLEQALEQIATSSEAVEYSLREFYDVQSEILDNARQEWNSFGRDAERAMGRARDALAGFTDRISEWLDQLNSTDKGMGTPQEQFQAAQSQFAAQLVLAESGDRDALGSITQYADRYLQSAQSMYASGSGAQQVRDEIDQALGTLPDNLSPEQFLADEFRDAIEGQTGSLLDEHSGLVGQLAEGFAGIDLSGEGLIDWGEFYAAFGDVADRETLQKIFGALDNNGSGAIDQLEAITRGTQTLVDVWTDQQPQDVQGAIEQITQLYESALGREPDLPGLQYWINDWLDGQSVDQIRQSIESHVGSGSGGGSDGAGGSGSGSGGSDGAGQQNPEPELSAIDQWLQGRSYEVQGWANALDAMYDEILSKEMDLAGLQYWIGDLQLGQSLADVERSLRASIDGSHRTGLDYVPRDGYLAELHRGEAVLTAEQATALRSAPVMPPLPPLLGQGDVIEVMRDLRSEVAQLRRELADSQRQIADNTGQTRDAVAGVGRHAAQQREQQLSEQRAANRALRRQKRGQTV